MDGWSPTFPFGSLPIFRFELLVSGRVDSLHVHCRMSTINIIALWVPVPFLRKTCLGGGFKYFLFSPLFGEDFHFD